MSFATQKLADLSVQFNTDEFATSIVYNGTTIPAIVDYGDSSFKYGMETGRQATVTVKVSDVASPSYRDTVVIGGVTWRTFRDERTDLTREGDGVTWQIPLIRDERPRAMPQ